MIGHVIGAYCEGVRDARAGHKRKRRNRESQDERMFYLLGNRDERARMREARRLAQYRLELFPEDPGADGPKPLP